MTTKTKPKDPMTGNEVCRYLSQSGRLISVRDDGTRWFKTFTGRKWVHRWTRKKEVPLTEWIQRKRERYAALPEWQKGVREFPSLRTLKQWDFDGVYETPSGCRVEPDGDGHDGSPSWLKIISFI